MAFERFARGLGDEERERSRRSWVDPKEPDILRAKAEILGEDESKFFSVLKDKEPLKWQKAVKEFWKSTAR